MLVLLGRRAHGLGHAEVRHHRDAAGEQHIVRLDIAVGHAELVGVGQRRHHVAEDVHRLAHGKLAAGHPRAERFAGDERHREVGEAVRFAGRQQRHDVGMLKLGGELDLATEAVHAHAGGELGQEDLHHHLPAQRRLVGDEHARHATPTQLPFEEVGVAQCGLELVPEILAHAVRIGKESRNLPEQAVAHHVPRPHPAP